MLTIGLSVALFSCKKHNDSVPKPCRIVAEYDTVFGATATGGSTRGAWTYFYEYDYRGRIIHMTTPPNSTDTFSKIWTYGPDYAYIYPGYDRGSTDTIYIDGNNQVTKVISVDPDNYVITLLFTYNAAGEVMTKTQTTNQSSNQYIITYSWSDGDMVSEKDNGGNITTHVYFTDKPASDGDPARHREIDRFGVPIVRNKHLLQSSSFGSGFANYNYTFDNSGRIVTVSESSGAFFLKTTYVYDCTH